MKRRSKRRDMEFKRHSTARAVLRACAGDSDEFSGIDARGNKQPLWTAADMVGAIEKMGMWGFAETRAKPPREVAALRAQLEDLERERDCWRALAGRGQDGHVIFSVRKMVERRDIDACVDRAKRDDEFVAGLQAKVAALTPRPVAHAGSPGTRRKAAKP